MQCKTQYKWKFPLKIEFCFIQTTIFIYAYKEFFINYANTYAGITLHNYENVWEVICTLFIIDRFS